MSTPPLPHWAIRQATSADLDAILALTVRDSQAGHYAAEIARVPAKFRGALAELVRTGQMWGAFPELGAVPVPARLYVAAGGGEVSGFAVARSIPWVPDVGMPRTAEVYMCSVATAAQRQGAGRALLRTALAELEQHKRVDVVLARCTTLTPGIEALLRAEAFRPIETLGRGALLERRCPK